MVAEMSFSQEVKKELEGNLPAAGHCRLAEFSALFCLCGKKVVDKRGQVHIKLQTENGYVIRKAFTLLQKTFHIDADIMIRMGQAGKKRLQYHLYIQKSEDAARVLAALNRSSLQKACCKRAYLRGAFLCAGSVNNPEKAYHFELVTAKKELAELLCGYIRAFGIDAKQISRKGHQVVYVKEGSQVADMLSVIGAHVALMNFENARIVKEMRNGLNRWVNCDAANIGKAVTAAKRQTEEILFIRDTVGLGQLPEGLAETAALRLEHPDASLKELGELLPVPVGKSGVRYRLEKISEFAESLKGIKGGTGNGVKGDDDSYSERPRGKAGCPVGADSEPI